jgi:hypothetical protein
MEREFPMKPERRCSREVMPAVAMPTAHPLVQPVARNVGAISGVERRVGAVVPQSYAGNDTVAAVYHHARDAGSSSYR